MATHRELLSLAGPISTEAHREVFKFTIQDERITSLIADWERLHRASVQHPEGFWPAFLQAIGFEFYQAPSRILTLSSDGNPENCVWFPGARMNIAACALVGPLHDLDARALVASSERHPDQYVFPFCSCLLCMTSNATVPCFQNGLQDVVQVQGNFDNQCPAMTTQESWPCHHL
jgi:hypothetical protein